MKKKNRKKMSKKTIAALVATVMISNSLGNTMVVFAQEGQSIVQSVTKASKENREVKQAEIQKFTMLNSADLAAYDKVFKLDNSKITQINNNGGHYGASTLSKAIDGDLKTHWESKVGNSSSLKNEITFTFDEITELNRIVYAARQDSHKGRGFAKQFEIYASTTESGDDFTLVTTGKSNSVGDFIEIKFAPTEFKRLKFKFLEIQGNYLATAAEFMFYKQDKVQEMIEDLFVDSSKYELKAEYQNEETIEQLATEVESHPLKAQLEEDIKVAKLLLHSEKLGEPTESKIEISNIAKSKYYSDYNEVYQIKPERFQSVTNNGGHYGQSVLTRLYDGNKATHWETGTANSGTFTNEVVFTFKDIEEIGRIILSSRKDANQKGFPLQYEIYGSLDDSSNGYKLITKGSTSSSFTEDTEIVFPKTKFKRLKFKFVKAKEYRAGLAEISFYSEDKVTDAIKNLFDDVLYTTVSKEYDSATKLEELENQVNSHPLKEDYLEILQLAKKKVNGILVEGSQIITLSQRGDENKQRNERRQVFAGGNLDLTGYYVMPDESFEVYVDADKDGILPQLVFSQVGEVDNNNTGNHRVNLKIGRNIVTAPGGTKAYAIYFANKALPKDQAYAPKVRIEGENLKQYPIYIHGKTDPEKYVEQVKNHTGANMTDVMGERFLISGRNSEAKIAYVDQNKTPLDTVEAFDKFITAFDKLSGYDENDENPIHRPSKALYHYKGNNASGLYASNEYIHYTWNSARNLFAGNFADWGYGHEFGHQIENSDMRLLEVTNNLYSIAGQKAVLGRVNRNFTTSQANVDKYFTYEGTKGFGGFPGDDFEYKFGLFERLLVITQITNYFGDEAYAKASRLIRENPSRYNATGSYQAMINAMSEATGYDLSSHFEYYNYPVTDATKKFTSQFKAFNKKIRYTTIDTYKKIENNIQTFDKNTKAVISSVKQEKDGFSFKLSTNDDNKGTIAYEIYRDGKMVGFNRTGTYKDTVDSSKEYKYQVIAYDYRANESIKSDIFETASIIYEPKLTVKNNITVKLNGKFNPLDYATAVTFDGKEIDSSKIEVVGTVDTEKRGAYEVTYRVTDRNNTVSKTVRVFVYEELLVTKSKYGEFNNLQKYNEQFKIPVASISNNGSNYGSSVITNAIDGKLNTHWETNKQNTASFKNEVIFDFGEVKEIARMAYGARQDSHKGRGFATKFEIYVSQEEKGDDFVLIGTGSYAGNAGDIVQTYFKPTNARRIKFKFVEANNGLTTFSEVAFYKDDALANLIANDLFTDSSKTDVKEAYNSLSKLEALRETVKNHPAYSYFNEEIKAAEKIVRAKLPVITASDFEAVELNSSFDLMTNVTAKDQEDGIITEKVVVDKGNFDITKTGTYVVSYSVTDLDSNTTTKERKILVYSKADYLSDMKWESATSGWKSVNKDSAVSSTNKIKLRVDGTVKEFEKGIGAATNAEIVYDLNGEYNYFTTYVGTDKNYDLDATTIIFKIYADGKEVYTSNLIKKDSNAEFVGLDVTGVKVLKLVANDAGDGGYGDFASWADTKVYTSNAKPELTIPKSVATEVGVELDLNEPYRAVDAEDGDITTKVEVTGKVNFNRVGKYPITYAVTDNDGNTVTKTRIISVVNMDNFDYLSDYSWKSISYSYKAPVKDKAMSGNAIRLTGSNGEVVYQKGIGSHAASTIIYDLSDKDYAYFTSYVGVDRHMYNTVGSVIFQVYVDGEKKFDSGLMKSKDVQKFVKVDISGAKELKLVVTDGGNGNGSDHASWGDTKLHFVKEEVVDYTALMELVQEANAYEKTLYTEDSYAVLERAIESANSILEDRISTQEEVNAAIEELQSAIDALEEFVDLTKAVTIEDKFLEQAIRKTLNVTGSAITIGDMYNLTSLEVQRVGSLQGLQYAKNLTQLNMEYNEVADLSPLKDLKNLTDLRANYQNIVRGMLDKKDNTIVMKDNILNRKGEKLLPTKIVVRNNSTFEAKTYNVDECINENGDISLDTTELSPAMYSVFLTYENEIDHYMAQVFYMFNNK